MRTDLRQIVATDQSVQGQAPASQIGRRVGYGHGGSPSSWYEISDANSEQIRGQALRPVRKGILAGYRRLSHFILQGEPLIAHAWHVLPRSRYPQQGARRLIPLYSSNLRFSFLIIYQLAQRVPFVLSVKALLRVDRHTGKLNDHGGKTPWIGHPHF